MKQRINSIGVLSCAKISAVVYGAISLVIMPFVLLAGVFISVLPRSENAPSGAALVVFAIIMPFFYAAIGFVAGALGAFVYNLAAKWVGGIEIDLQPAAGAAIAAGNPQ